MPENPQWTREQAITQLKTFLDWFTQFDSIEAERLRLQQELERQAALLELTHDAIIVRDMQDRITFWNRGAEAQYGWTAAEVRGRVIHTLLQTTFPQPFEAIMHELLQRGR